MARKDDNQTQFKLYKEDVQRRGKPFFPYAMFHDTVMSFVVVAVIIALASIWYFTSGPEPGDSGVLGPRYAEQADPGTTQFIPRPDWYFYFLFYLLRIFKWPETVILATIGIPTILLILLIMVPFYDRRRERRIARRPVAVVAALLVVASMGVLTYKGATAKESLGSENVGARPAVGPTAEPFRRRREGSRRSSPSPAVWAATPTSARAPRTSGRPTSPPRAQRAAARSSRSTTSSARAA